MADSPNADWLGLSGRICVITGAAGGIGSTLATGFAHAGAKVALLDRDLAGCDAVASRIRGTGGEAVAIACDISDSDSVDSAAVECAKRLGPCDVLINNAAALHSGPLVETAVSRWNELLSTNLTGYFLCSKAFGRPMLERRRGSIVHVASIAGYYPQSYSGAYSVSKAGVLMLSQILAVEMGEYNIRSNVVSPAMVRTPLSEPFYSDPELLRRRETIVPSRRIGTPTDIMEACLFLASERASYVNGQELLVDGGVSRALLGLIPRPGYERGKRT